MMSDSTCMICDEHGNQLADGIDNEGGLALRAAKNWANRLGKTVYVYEPGDTDETAMPVEPS
jgi:hypothetical protein